MTGAARWLAALVPLLGVAACCGDLQSRQEMERLEAENARLEAQVAKLEAELEVAEGQKTDLQVALDAVALADQRSPGGASVPDAGVALTCAWVGDHYDLHGDLFAETDALSRQARLIPHFEDGAVHGYELLAIREGSTFDQCGFRSGDIVRTINGVPLDSPERSLEAYALVNESRELIVDFTRAGGGHTARIVLSED